MLIWLACRAPTWRWQDLLPASTVFRTNARYSSPVRGSTWISTRRPRQHADNCPIWQDPPPIAHRDEISRSGIPHFDKFANSQDVSKFQRRSFLQILWICVMLRQQYKYRECHIQINSTDKSFQFHSVAPILCRPINVDFIFRQPIRLMSFLMLPSSHILVKTRIM